jgi:hypothetical protein
MSNPYGSHDLKLQKAAEFIKAGQKNEARQLLRDILVADQNNLAAWELLAYATNNIQEETYCLNRILKFRPDHPWAKQRLAAINPPAPSVESPPEVERPLPKPETAPGMPGRTPASQRPRQVEKPRKRRREIAPLLLGIFIFGGILMMGFMIFYFGYLPSNPSAQQTKTSVANNTVLCQELIERALQVSGSACDQIDSNNVCYGNDTLLAELIPDASMRFSERGDIVGIDYLHRLSVSPINLDTQEWGIAIFKVMANLPRSLPGETVTLMVFGNTTIDNESQNLETFYFSSGLGEIVCEKVPFDGIMLTMPDGTGIRFVVNGAELMLMGNASLTATENGEMVVKLFSGSGQITSLGQTQSFGAGQQVSVQLGGLDGREAVSVPSSPVPLSPEDLVLACTMTGQYCSADEIQPVSEQDIQQTLQAGLLGTPTLQGTATISLTPTITRTPTTSLTGTITFTPSMTPTPSKTPTITRTGTITRTPTRTLTPTRTYTTTKTLAISLSPSYTSSPTSSPSDTKTPTMTFTPTQTLERTNTLPFTSTPLCQVSAGSLGTSDSKTLSILLTNNAASAQAITGITVNWVNPGGQIMQEIRLASTKISNQDDPDSPSTIPGEIPWFGSTSARSIPSWGSKTLEINFHDTLEPTGYSVTISFGADCQVQGSK